MTYTVLGGTLNPHSLIHSLYQKTRAVVLMH